MKINTPTRLASLKAKHSLTDQAIARIIGLKVNKNRHDHLTVAKMLKGTWTGNWKVIELIFKEWQNKL